MSRTRTGMMAAFAAGLLAAGCGGGYGGGGSSMPTSSGSTTGAGSTSEVVITIAGMSFSPSSVTVQAGQAVVWKNTDTMAHTATQDGANGFDTGMIPSGGTSKAITITDTGAIHYHCSVHPGMIATLNGTSSGGGY